MVRVSRVKIVLKFRMEKKQKKNTSKIGFDSISWLLHWLDWLGFVAFVLTLKFLPKKKRQKKKKDIGSDSIRLTELSQYICWIGCG